MAVERFPRQRVARPHTTIQTDTSGITGVSTGSDKLVMLIGSAKGGEPNTVYRVRNYIQAKEIFRGGELLDAMELAWNPSPNSPGAGDILAMRVEDAGMATLEHGGIKFQSKLFGEEANSIQVSIEDTEVAGIESRNVTVEFAPENYRNVYRNVGTIFQVSYDGDGEATIEVAGGKLTLTAGESTQEFLLESPNVKHANSLVNVINGVAGFSATMPTGMDKNIESVKLDNLASTPVDSDGVTVKAFAEDLKRQLQFDKYVGVEIDSVTEVEELGLTPLEGGEDGEVPASWSDKLQHMAHEGGYYLVPITPDSSIHNEAKTFAKGRSDEGEPMRVIVGGSIADSKDVNSLQQRAGDLRDSRVSFVGFTSEKTLGDGSVKRIPPYMNAALVAGLASGIGIGESITFKEVSINALEDVYEGVQLDVLNQAGVVMAEFVRNRAATKFRIVDDVTTFNDLNDPVKNQMAVGEANDFLVSELKNYLDDNFIGTQTKVISPSLMKNSIQTFLDQKKRDNEIQDYTPEDVQVVIHGDVAEISLVIYPIRSLKKINVSLVYRQQVLTSY